MHNNLLHLTQRSTFLFVHSLALIVAQKSTTTASQMSKALEGQGYIGMASDEQLEIYKVLRESQSKYTYFILAAAGRAIGFTLTQANNFEIAYSQIPSGFAVFFGGLGFDRG